jgi:zinc transport system permease protein
MIEAILRYAFMRNALIASLLASVVVAIIGTVAIEKKLISMSGGIAHASFGGIGLGYLLGFEPILGGLLFAIFSSALMRRLPPHSKLNADTMMGILWSFGMALGILFIALAPGYMPDMTSYLFGDILAVSTTYVWYMAAFTAVIVLLFFMLYNHMLLYLFDEAYAFARGVNTNLLAWIVYLMLPVGIIVLLKVVGIVLTIALMTIPVSLAKLLFKSIGKVIIAAMVLSFAFCLAGLMISYYVAIPSGASIAVLSTLVYLVVLWTHGSILRHRHRHEMHEQTQKHE